jgi:hypothetical protein
MHWISLHGPIDSRYLLTAGHAKSNSRASRNQGERSESTKHALLENHAVAISQDNGQKTGRPAKMTAPFVKKKRSVKCTSLVTYRWRISSNIAWCSCWESKFEIASYLEALSFDHVKPVYTPYSTTYPSHVGMQPNRA